jgi:hypothetical protein
MHRVRLTLAMAVAALTLALVAGPVHAVVHRGTVYSTNNKASSTWRHDTHTERRYGVLTDRSPNNGKCARLYDRGYDAALGQWSAWSLRKRVCAGGSVSWSFTPTEYADMTEIKVCDGGMHCRVKHIAP